MSKLTAFVPWVKDICGVEGVEGVALRRANSDASGNNAFRITVTITITIIIIIIE